MADMNCQTKMKVLFGFKFKSFPFFEGGGKSNLFCCKFLYPNLWTLLERVNILDVKYPYLVEKAG